MDYVLRRHEGWPFTIREIADALDAKTDDPVRRAIYGLRDAEALGRPGRSSLDGARSACDAVPGDGRAAGDEYVKALQWLEPRSRCTITVIRELLHMMLDEADGQGWISAQDLARALAIEAKHPAQHVGTRLGWMRKYGAVERQAKEPMWRPTSMGRALATGDLGSDMAERCRRCRVISC